MTAATLPAGKKLCPGWSSEYSREQGVDPDGYRLTYSATKASGLAVKYACGDPPSGRRSDPSIIAEGLVMCSRCRRQKSKFDDDNGARERRVKEDRENYQGLIAAYAEDVKRAIPAGTTMPDTRTFLAAVLVAVDGLAPRRSFPPYEQAANYAWVSDEERVNVLRLLAGLEVSRGRR